VIPTWYSTEEIYCLCYYWSLWLVVAITLECKGDRVNITNSVELTTDIEVCNFLINIIFTTYFLYNPIRNSSKIYRIVVSLRILFYSVKFFEEMNDVIDTWK